MAGRLEGGDAEAVKEAAELLRKAATRMGALERSLGEVGQALIAVHQISGQMLPHLGVGAAAEGSSASAAPALLGASEEGTKSYLMKKGDADVQQAYQALSQQRPTNNSSTSGVLSTAATTKEEMDQARRARLERLEAQQAEKMKQQVDAKAKSKARDSLFERPLAGAQKVMGKH